MLTDFGVQFIIGVFAVAAFCLSLYNFIYAKGEPVRARQRELQLELASLLHKAKREIEAAKTKADFGQDIGAAPDSLTGHESEIKRLSASITAIPTEALYQTATGISLVKVAWSSVHMYEAQVIRDETGQQRSASMQQFVRHCNDALTNLNGHLSTLARLERGERS